MGTIIVPSITMEISSIKPGLNILKDWGGCTFAHKSDITFYYEISSKHGVVLKRCQNNKKLSKLSD
jgi:hypothetical protein